MGLKKKRRFRLKLKNGCISPCVVLYRSGGWETKLARLSDGLEFSVSRFSKYWYQVPKNFQIGDKIRITCWKGIVRDYVDLEFVSLSSNNRIIVEVIESSKEKPQRLKKFYVSRIASMRQEILQMEDRFKELCK